MYIYPTKIYIFFISSLIYDFYNTNLNVNVCSEKFIGYGGDDGGIDGDGESPQWVQTSCDWDQEPLASGAGT